MSKYCPESERVKREYAFHLETANGKQMATIGATLRAIEALETSTNFKPFRKFHVAQVRSFRARLSEALNAQGKPLSAATITSTLKNLHNFFLWLSREPGYRSAINANDANYFTPSEPDVRIGRRCHGTGAVRWAFVCLRQRGRLRYCGQPRPGLPLPRRWRSARNRGLPSCPAPRQST